MSAKDVLKVFVGSITVYGAIAACSAASSPAVPSAMADVNSGGTRLKANYYAGSDGSQQFLSTFHDVQRSEDCAFTTASDGSIRCLPTAVPGPIGSVRQYSVYYSDAACTTPIAAVSTCSGNMTPSYVTVGGPPITGLGKGSVLYKLGSVTTVGAAYQLSYTSTMGTGNACANPFSSLTPTCTPVPLMAAAGMDDAGSGPAAGPPLPAGPGVTWPSVEASSMIYSLVEVPPSDFVEATTKTTM